MSDLILIASIWALCGYIGIVILGFVEWQRGSSLTFKDLIGSIVIAPFIGAVALMIGIIELWRAMPDRVIIKGRGN